MPYDSLLPYFVVNAAAAMLLLMAMWAGISRRHWFLRSAIVCVLLAGLYPIRAFVPLIWFSVAMPLTAWICRAMSRRYGTEDPPNQMPQGKLQLRLSDLLLLIVLASVAAAVAAGLLRQRFYIDWRLGGIVLCCTVMALICFVAVVMKGGWRLIGLIGLPIAIAGSTVLYAYALYGSSIDELGTAMYQGGLVARLYNGFAAVCVFVAMVLLGLLLGFTMRPLQNLSNRGQWSLFLLARIVLIGIALAVVTPLLMIYVRMLQGPGFPSTSFPEDNSLVRVEEVNEEISRIDPGFVAPTPYRQLGVTANDIEKLDLLLAELMSSLATPGYVPFNPKTDAHQHYFYSTAIRSAQQARYVAEMLSVEADYAAQASQFDKASAYSLALIRLGNSLSRGGLHNHWIVGSIVEELGSRAVIRDRKQVTLSQTQSLLAALVIIDQSREPLAVVTARENAYSDRAFNWVRRLRLASAWLQGRPHEPIFERQLAMIELTRDTTLRLLIVDLAISIYSSKHGHPPADLQQLTPVVLDSVPLDPCSGQPFIYRTTDDSWMLYSVGGGGQDDGGRFGTSEEGIHLPAGFDFDLDQTVRDPIQEPFKR